MTSKGRSNFYFSAMCRSKTPKAQKPKTPFPVNNLIIMFQSPKNPWRLTIAHKLNTVISSDKVLLLSKGEVTEYDVLKKLMEDKSSIFLLVCKETMSNWAYFHSIILKFISTINFDYQYSNYEQLYWNFVWLINSILNNALEKLLLILQCL